ncbi:MAG TPA: NAD(P)H-dependent oxidoreductase [Burkholderiales bacterium]|nr:NAD(P)H-dependent oxidoreductase [Burkholderiales bacterium]
MTRPKVLAFAGATRTQSWNKKLIRIAARAAEEAGADVTLIDLRDYPMPVYDGDLERAEGLPPKARELKALMVANRAFLLSCPEYNSSISAVLKNTIDWISRPQPDEPPAYAFRDKVAGLLAASPGNLGGVRGLFTVRQVLTTLGVLVLPTQFALAHAASAFHEDGTLKEDGHRAAVAAVVERLVGVTARLQPE